MDCCTPGFPIPHYLPDFAQLRSIESVMLSNHLILCCPLLPQSFPAARSFPMSRLFTSGGQSIQASVLASVLPMNIQDWFPLELTGLISLLSKMTLKSFLQHHSAKASILQSSTFFMVQLSFIHSYWKTQFWLYRPQPASDGSAFQCAV